MRLLAVLTLFFSVHAFSCPNLTGRYLKCESSTGTGATDGQLDINQALTNGITTYTIRTIDPDNQIETEEVVKANGKTTSTTQTDPDSGLVVKTYITGSCTSTAFNMRVAIYMDGDQVANVTTRYSKVGNQLHQQLSGSAMGDVVSDKIICE